MTASPTGKEPLQVCQVMEEEFQHLHGPLPAGYPVGGSEKDRVLALRAVLHAVTPRRSALCFSGGGIRSATFNLGVLQALARAGVLHRFDYLSTVSGGGYIGGWLSAWMARERQRDPAVGTQTVVDALSAHGRANVEPEPHPIRWLRSYSNYLSPKLGLFSADTWSLVGTWIRNILLNWLVVLPILSAVLIVPAFLVALVASPTPKHFLVGRTMLALGFALGILALIYIGVDQPSSKTPKHSARGFVVLCWAPVWFATGLLMLFWSWYPLEDASQIWFIGGGAAVAAAAVALGKIWNWIRHRTPPWERYSKWMHWFQGSVIEWTALVLSGALAGWLVWIIATQLAPDTGETRELYVIFGGPLLVGALLLAVTLNIAMSSRVASEDDREWWARSGGWFLSSAIIWIGASTLVLLGPDLVGTLGAWAKGGLASAGGISGLIGAYVAFRSQKEDAATGSSRQVVASLLSKWGLRALTLAFVLTLLLGLVHLNRLLIGSMAAWFGEPLPHPLWTTAAAMLGLAAVTLIASGYIGINTFSLHAMYGNRLVRAYLGASNRDRHPHPFIGFDPEDNLRMRDMVGYERGESGAFDPARAQRPFHVVNLALNLVRGKRLAWQQRKAKSFTVSPLHAGSFSGTCAYRRSEDYSAEGRGISLGKAVTISGAAASPNMGYHSSPLITFLMTLFNARLGWWLGNPGDAGARTWTQNEPRFALRPILAEALGWTTDENPYVYLSDGGHFENLALYEMILRRCGVIVAIDAGCDPEFGFADLSNAIHKIRADLGIEIRFSEAQRPTKELLVAQGCAVGTIVYSAVDAGARDGTLIYLKPVLMGDEPVDVRRYALEHCERAADRFPHQTTNDQWFDESQFESYRRLGLHLAGKLGAGPFDTVEEFVAQAAARAKGASPAVGGGAA